MLQSQNPCYSLNMNNTTTANVDRQPEIEQALAYIQGIAFRNYNVHDLNDILSMVKVKLLTDWQPGKGLSAKSFAVMAYNQTRTTLAVERAALSCSVSTYNNRLAGGVEDFGNSLQATSLDTPLAGDDGESEDSLQGVVAEPLAETPSELVERKDLLQALRRQLVAIRTKGENESRAIHICKLRYINNLGLVEIGERLGISAERVRQIENFGLSLLRNRLTKMTA